jgi:hypothetical protein
MGVNYRVIFPSRYHLGNEPNIFAIANPPPFVGKTQDWTFDCPDVDARETGVLLFQSYDVTTGRNVFEINSVAVFGGIPVGPQHQDAGSNRRTNIWMSHVLLVESRHQLKATGNVLHVEAQAAQAGGSDVDDFLLDNMVIMYKTLGRVPPVTGGSHI